RSELARRFLDGAFDDILEEVDRITGSANTIPDWFYRRTWHRKHAISDASLLARGADVLIFSSDDVGFGHELLRLLRQRGVRACLVVAGASFARHEADLFSVNPRRRDDYVRLVRTLTESGIRASHVLHLWGCAASPETSAAALEDAQYLGALS